MATSFFGVANNAKSKLDGDVAVGDLAITVQSAVTFNPAALPFYVTVWDGARYPDSGDDHGAGAGDGMEIMLVTNVVGNVFTIVRAQRFTADVAHVDGNDVRLHTVDDHFLQLSGVAAAHDHSVAGDGASALNPATVDALEIFNSAGDLKVMPDVQGDVVLFGDTNANRVFKLVGLIGAARKYGSVGIDDTNDELLIALEDAAVTGVAVKLSDAAGASEFRIRDSGGTKVAYIYSNGGACFTDMVRFDTSANVRMLNSSGNVAEIRGTGGLKFYSHSGGWKQRLRVTNVGNVGIGTDAPATLLELAADEILTGNVADDYAAALTLDPGYTVTDGGNHTITRHNYIDVNQPSETETSGTITITDAAVLRFDAVAGTHKAVDAGTAHPDIDNTDAWIKVNVGGTIHYIPCYTDKS